MLFRFHKAIISARKWLITCSLRCVYCKRAHKKQQTIASSFRKSYTKVATRWERRRLVCTKQFLVSSKRTIVTGVPCARYTIQASSPCKRANGHIWPNLWKPVYKKFIRQLAGKEVLIWPNACLAQLRSSVHWYCVTSLKMIAVSNQCAFLWRSQLQHPFVNIAKFVASCVLILHINTITFGSALIFVANYNIMVVHNLCDVVGNGMAVGAFDRNWIKTRYTVHFLF